MSGIAVGWNTPHPEKVETMFSKMTHRGPYLSGTRTVGKAVLAQNYVRADTAGAAPDATVPFSDGKDGLTLCFDGQIGNWRELAARYDVEDGPFREERLVLTLYRRYGEAMLDKLDDTIFCLVITDGSQLLAARDLLGIKTLFYAEDQGALYLATELKSIITVSSKVYEFPAGQAMNADGRFRTFTALPDTPPTQSEEDIDAICGNVRRIIQKSFDAHVDFSNPTGALLSGGMDSSVISLLAAEAVKANGGGGPLRTYAIGVGESSDILNARIMAKFIGSDHQELYIGIEEIIEALPEVIYYLEHFDPSLVRSSVANFLISKKARAEGIEVLLSGEGGDEVFCGYGYLKRFSPEKMFPKQMQCLGYLHNNAALRLDRMNYSHSIRVVTPLISSELLQYALTIPPEFKIRTAGEEKIEKWIFRKAYENLLPEVITWRYKQEFSQGSGSADALLNIFEEKVSDDTLQEARTVYPNIRSKEEAYYFNIFKDHFGAGKAAETVGQWPLL
ncbi:MAG: asparagine synthase-related protein [Desulfococcaceae bacterium]